MVCFFSSQISADVDVESAEMAFSKLDKFVLASCPKWDSNGVFLVWKVTKNLRGKVPFLHFRGSSFRLLDLLVLNSSVIESFFRPIRLVDLRYRICSLYLVTCKVLGIFSR